MKKAIVLASLTCLLASCGKTCCRIPNYIDFNTYAEWSYFYDRYKEIYPERYLVPKQDGNDVIYRFVHISDEYFSGLSSLFKVEYENREMNISLTLEGVKFDGICYDVVGADISNIEMISLQYNDVWCFYVIASGMALFRLFTYEFPKENEVLERYKSLFTEWLTYGIEDIF